MPPEISVILPFFNAGKTLAAAIESILFTNLSGGGYKEGKDFMLMG
jgi:hypothetical protein